MILMNVPPPDIIESLKAFLREDVRSGDITTNAMTPMNTQGEATVFAKCKAVLAGLEEVIAIAEFSGLTYEVFAYEGNWVSPGDQIIKFTGSAKTLLTVERLCLNIIQRMSGIATKTYNMVKAARKGNPSVIVAATRKTTPGFRYFEKRAVQVGGGDPHRYALDDMVMIKNNHITVVGGIDAAVKAAKEAVSFSKKITCEVRSLSECIEAIKAGADIVMLDNFNPEDVAMVHKELRKHSLRDKILLETSGGIDESNVMAYAEGGIDIVSSGALTHSYDSADFNMLISMK